MNIVPVDKGGDRKASQIYRPVSLKKSVIRSIREAVIKKRYRKHVEETNSLLTRLVNLVSGVTVHESEFNNVLFRSGRYKTRKRWLISPC